MTAAPAADTPWWTTASLHELAASAPVVADFVREGDAPSADETMRFARALALQTLCSRPSALAEAVAAADALTDSYREWTVKGSAPAERKDPSGWVRRSSAVRQGFELCLAMLPRGVADSVAPRMKQFAQRSKALEEADRNSYFLEGTRVPFTVRTWPRRNSEPD
ncbi:MAG TPA: hypothetical protein VLD35_05505 [Caldimonas sp.]|nr:hypothetical protein [Caldimonas sp.]